MIEKKNKELKKKEEIKKKNNNLLFNLLVEIKNKKKELESINLMIEKKNMLL